LIWPRIGVCEMRDPAKTTNQAGPLDTDSFEQGSQEMFLLVVMPSVEPYGAPIITPDIGHEQAHTGAESNPRAMSLVVAELLIVSGEARRLSYAHDLTRDAARTISQTISAMAMYVITASIESLSAVDFTTWPLMWLAITLLVRHRHHVKEELVLFHKCKGRPEPLVLTQPAEAALARLSECRARRWHRWCWQGRAIWEVVPDLRPSAARDDRLGRCSSGVYDARSEYEIIVAISEDRGVQAGFPRPVLSAGCL
jgi:hypothetical protein